MAEPTSAVDPWVRCSHPAPEAPARVVCSPHVGGAGPLTPVEVADLRGRREHPTAAFRAGVLPGDHSHPVAQQDALLGTPRRLEVGR